MNFIPYLNRNNAVGFAEEQTRGSDWRIGIAMGDLDLSAPVTVELPWECQWAVQSRRGNREREWLPIPEEPIDILDQILVQLRQFSGCNARIGVHEYVDHQVLPVLMGLEIHQMALLLLDEFGDDIFQMCVVHSA